MKGALEDLRNWIEKVRKLGLLREVKGANLELEIGSITDVNSKLNKYALLFDEIKGYPRGFRVLTGALLDAKRVAITLNLPCIEEDIKLTEIIKEKMRSVDKLLTNYDPEYINDSPLMENIKKGDEINLFQFPAPKWFKGDGGRYIGTADCVITKDRNSEWVNVGTYRAMIQSRNTLSILIEGPRHARAHMHGYFKEGEPCPVAISFGHHPAIYIFASLEVPKEISEYNYAGAMLGKPYKVIEGPVTGLPIPADSEIAIEGYIYNKLTEEGPFGSLPDTMERELGKLTWLKLSLSIIEMIQ